MRRGWIALLGGMAMGFALCLGAQEEIHKNSYRIDLSTKGQAKTGDMVAILSCDTKHAFVVPYEDKNLTVPMANPLVVPVDGQLGFFLPVGEEVEGERWGKSKTPLFRCVHGAHVPEVIMSGSVQAKMQENGDVIVDPALHAIERIKERVRSCEERQWPVTDPICHGYALSMAHDYYQEHPELYAEVEKSIAIGSGDDFVLPSVTNSKITSFYPITATPSLTCGPYQHLYHWPGDCGPVPCVNLSCEAVCTPVPYDKCVDDMHEVTEREWQSVLERLKALEQKETEHTR